MSEAVSDLATLLKSMRPSLDAAPYLITTMTPAEIANLGSSPFAAIKEAEATTVVIAESVVVDPSKNLDRYAKITLGVWSALEAVGLTAAIATALAGNDIPANVIAGYYHDHIFVPWHERNRALKILHTLRE